MIAFFCTETGVRIVAPGVSKYVDPVGGQDECIEIDGKLVSPKSAPMAPSLADKKSKKSEPTAAAPEVPADAPAASAPAKKS